MVCGSIKYNETKGRLLRRTKEMIRLLGRNENKIDELAKILILCY